MDSEVFRDYWDDFQKNRGYRPDVVRRVNAARREELRRAEIKARKEARKAAKSPARPVAALMVPEFQARLAAARRVGTVFEKLEALTCIVFGVTRQELRGSSRKREMVFARQFLIYWTCRRTSLSLPHIGRKIGGRDHTTVLHGARGYVDKRKAMGRTLRQAR